MASRSIARSCTQLATSSTARAFLQLAPSRSLHSAPPVLDFLLPSIPRSALQQARASNNTSTKDHTQARRGFTSSVSRRSTTAIYNSRNDDDGNAMHIEITPRASNRLKQIMSKDANPNLALRIQVESGGCHGFQYLMSLTTLPSVDSFTNSGIKEESSPALNTRSNDPNAMPSGPVFSTPASQAPRPEPTLTGTAPTKEGILDDDDTVFAADDGSGAKVVMDGPSLELLKGSKVDFTMELIGSQFKIVDNPLATSSCGCGTSFDIK